MNPTKRRCLSPAAACVYIPSEIVTHILSFILDDSQLLLSRLVSRSWNLAFSTLDSPKAKVLRSTLLRLLLSTTRGIVELFDDPASIRLPEGTFQRIAHTLSRISSIPVLSQKVRAYLLRFAGRCSLDVSTRDDDESCLNKWVAEDSPALATAFTTFIPCVRVTELKVGKVQRCKTHWYDRGRRYEDSPMTTHSLLLSFTVQIPSLDSNARRRLVCSYFSWVKKSTDPHLHLNVFKPHGSPHVVLEEDQRNRDEVVHRSFAIGDPARDSRDYGFCRDWKYSAPGKSLPGRRAQAMRGKIIAKEKREEAARIRLPCLTAIPGWPEEWKEITLKRFEEVVFATMFELVGEKWRQTEVTGKRVSCPL